jgi:ubiquinone/menaquinone biosynthesis C-methylase UbiE
MTLATEYDTWHQRVFDSDPAHEDADSPWYNLVLEYLVPLKDKRVLEIACGRGGFARLLASKGAATLGADFSFAALQLAARNTRNGENGRTRLDLTQADANYLPFADGSFDVIVSCETIEHLPNPRSALHEMARVCRRGGLLYLTTPNYFNAMGLYYLYAQLRRRSATPGSDQPVDYVHLFPEIRWMLGRVGWKVLKTDGAVHQFPIRRGHSPIRLAALESNRFVRRILSPLAFHYFIMARRSAAP